MKKAGLILMMLFMLVSAGCANSAKPNNSDAASPDPGGSSANAEPATELVVLFPTASIPKEMDLIVNEINKISKAKINATIKAIPVQSNSFKNQMTLMLTSGEQVDLMATGSLATLFDYNGQITRGQLAPLDDLLASHGQDITAALQGYATIGGVNGKIYGVPNNRDLANYKGIVMRGDLVDKYSIDINAIKTIDDVGNVLKLIKQNEPSMYPIVPFSSTGTISYLLGMGEIDPLGDFLGALMDYGQTLEVVNYYETPEYESLVTKIHEWFEAGYILPDAAINSQQNGFEYVKANQAFSYPSDLKPGVEVQESRKAGMTMVATHISEPFSMTQKPTSFMWAIPSVSKNAQKAMEFLNLTFVDEDIINLFSWGIEGKHYVKSAEGLDYPEGVDAATVGYTMPFSFMFGNQFLSGIWKGTPQDLWVQTEQFNQNAKKSEAFGFTFNSESVKSEYAAVTSVVSQYKNSLENGAADPKTVLPVFIQKLKAAGIDKIIAEKQKQLDQWAASK
jgi:putative aldouronate transport system substrate-binding protein